MCPICLTGYKSCFKVASRVRSTILEKSTPYSNGGIPVHGESAKPQRIVVAQNFVGEAIIVVHQVRCGNQSFEACVPAVRYCNGDRIIERAGLPGATYPRDIAELMARELIGVRAPRLHAPAGLNIVSILTRFIQKACESQAMSDVGVADGGRTRDL